MRFFFLRADGRCRRPAWTFVSRAVDGLRLVKAEKRRADSGSAWTWPLERLTSSLHRFHLRPAVNHIHVGLAFVQIIILIKAQTCCRHDDDFHLSLRAFTSANARHVHEPSVNNWLWWRKLLKVTENKSTYRNPVFSPHTVTCHRYHGNRHLPARLNICSNQSDMRRFRSGWKWHHKQIQIRSAVHSVHLKGRRFIILGWKPWKRCNKMYMNWKQNKKHQETVLVLVLVLTETAWK